MSRTNRTNRYGKKHKEGQDMIYRCRCSYCTGKNDAVDKAHLKEFKIEEDMEEHKDKALELLDSHFWNTTAARTTIRYILEFKPTLKDDTRMFWTKVGEEIDKL